MSQKMNPNYDRDKTYERIMALRAENRSDMEIAEIFNAEGLLTARNLRFTGMLVQSIYAAVNRVRRLEKYEKKKRERSIMMTIPPAPREEPRSSGKVVAVMGEIEDVTEILKGWMK